MSEPSIYHHAEIDPRWQARWDADGLYNAEVNPSRPKHYALTMLPYPSGDLHIGHWYAMTPSDARARFMRMKGYNVLFPMGYDAYGLPDENAAIKSGIHPMVRTRDNVVRMRTQLRTMGAMFDWEREAVSCEPDYYKWTEWFFIQLYKMGLAYRKMSPVDFCRNCNTTLAREQVWGEDRHCERCGTPVIKKDLNQWFFKITAYAEELLDFSELNWPDRVRAMQTNWIGRSEGASEVVFKTEQGGHDLPIFTTRPWSREIASAAATLLPTNLAAPGADGLYRLTASGATSWFGFARAILESPEMVRLGVAPPALEAIPTSAYPTPARPANSRLDCGRLECCTGIRPAAWDAALARALDELA